MFRDYWDLLRPRSRGVTLAAAAGEMDSLDVFESGSYTVVLSRDARLTEIREALHGLPSGKRMEVDVPKAKIFAAYKKLYPGWHIAICVWEGHVEAEPILWWYDPMPEYKDRHFLPGLDAHDGRPPDLGAEVRADHTLIIGVAADDHRAGNAGEVVQSASTHLRKWLPDTVRGSQVEERLPNGDWVLPKDGWDWRNEIERIHLTPRVQPPGVAAA